MGLNGGLITEEQQLFIITEFLSFAIFVFCLLILYKLDNRTNGF